MAGRLAPFRPSPDRPLWPRAPGDACPMLPAMPARRQVNDSAAGPPPASGRGRGPASERGQGPARRTGRKQAGGRRRLRSAAGRACGG